MSDFNYGTGKRKNAVARTRLYQGTGQITINDRPYEEYFPRRTDSVQSAGTTVSFFSDIVYTVPSFFAIT